MYGANTEQSRMFLEKCVNDIRQFGLELPSVECLAKLRKGDDPWGEAIDEAEYRKVMDDYGIN